MADALTIVLLPPRAQPTAAALKIKLPPSWRAKRIGRLKEKLVAQRDRTHATALTGARLKLGRTLLDDDVAVGSLFAREAEPCLSLEGDALRYPASLAAGAVARVPVADDARVLAALRSGTPVVITGGCGLARPLVDAGWSIDDMAERGSAYDKFSAHYAPKRLNKFPRKYAAWSADEASRAGGIATCSLRSFAERSRDDPDLDFYFQCPLIWYDDGDGNAARDAAPDGGAKSAPLGDALLRDLRKIEWPWLKRVREAAGWGRFDLAQLWAGRCGGVTPLHYDEKENFLAQICGRKHVLLFPRSQSFDLYPYPPSHTLDNYAMPDLEAPDVFDAYPGLRNARGATATLDAGDVLHIPAGYWHFVQQLDPGGDRRPAAAATFESRRKRRTVVTDARCIVLLRLGVQHAVPAVADVRAPGRRRRVGGRRVGFVDGAVLGRRLVARGPLPRRLLRPSVSSARNKPLKRNAWGFVS